MPGYRRSRIRYRRNYRRRYPARKNLKFKSHIGDFATSQGGGEFRGWWPDQRLSGLTWRQILQRQQLQQHGKTPLSTRLALARGLPWVRW